MFRKYIYLTAPISKYLNTSPYFSLVKSFLLESNSTTFPTVIISYFTIFNLHTSHTFIYHTYYKYYIPQNIYIFYHLHTAQEISNTHTKSPSHGRHKLLTKALLLESSKISYQSPSHGRHRSILHKTLLLEFTNPSYIKPFS